MPHPVLHVRGTHVGASHPQKGHSWTYPSMWSVCRARGTLRRESVLHPVHSTHAGCLREKLQASQYQVGETLLLTSSLAAWLAGPVAVPRTIALLLSYREQLSPSQRYSAPNVLRLGPGILLAAHFRQLPPHRWQKKPTKPAAGHGQHRNEGLNSFLRAGQEPA